jgi:hypothetical protein
VGVSQKNPLSKGTNGSNLQQHEVTFLKRISLEKKITIMPLAFSSLENSRKQGFLEQNDLPKKTSTNHTQCVCVA